MPNLLRVAAVIAVIAVAGFAALNFVGGGPGVGSVPSPSPSSAPPTAAPTPIDTSTWTRYTSDRYGFSIAHPGNWTERPAEGAWAFPDDVDWLTDASEGFRNGAYLVTAWSVAVEPGTSAEEWITEYCPLSTSPCTAVQDAGEAVSVDGHDGLIVPFLDDIQAFVLIDDRMYVVAMWRPEGFAPGTRDVFDAFLSTVRLLPGGPMPAASESPPA